MCEKTATNENLIVLQNELCKMLKEFKTKCEENKLNYFLGWGTLLGAVRHKGFIPWDDDIDIFMTRENVDRFVELFKDYYSDECYIDGYNCKEFNSFAPNFRVNSRHFMLRQDKDGKEAYIPAFLSIFVVDALPNNKVLRKLHMLRIDWHYSILRFSRSNVQGVATLKNRSFKEKIFITLNKTFKLGALVSPRKAAKGYNDALRKYSINEKTKLVHIIWPGETHRVVNRKIFETCDHKEFDGVEFNVPGRYDELLSLLYGDYMKLPPEEARQPRHSTEFKIV